MSLGNYNMRGFGKQCNVSELSFVKVYIRTKKRCRIILMT